MGREEEADWIHQELSSRLPAIPEADMGGGCLLVDEDVWQGFPARGTERKPLKIRAIFEIRPEKETKQYGVWTGRAESEPVEALFSKWNDSE